MSATTTREDNIQQQILQAAKQLFQAYGLYKVTMDDVAKAIGKGRSSLYYYYKSKDEIFDAVMNAEIKEMMATVSQATDRVTTIEEKITAFCTAKFKLLREKNSVYNALEIGMDADALSQFNKTKIIHHKLIMKLESDLLTNIFNYSINKNEISSLTQTEQETIIFVLLSTLHGLKREMRMGHNPRQIDSAVTTVAGMINNMLKK